MPFCASINIFIIIVFHNTITKNKMKHISTSINESLQSTNDLRVVNESQLFEQDVLKMVSKEIISHYKITGKTGATVKEDDKLVTIEFVVDVKKNLPILSSIFGYAKLILTAKKATLNVSTKRAHLKFDATLHLDSTTIDLDTLITYFADDHSLTIVE